MSKMASMCWQTHVRTSWLVRKHPAVNPRDVFTEMCEGFFKSKEIRRIAFVHWIVHCKSGGAIL